MAAKRITWYGEDVLMERCAEVHEVTDETRAIIDDMFDTMYEGEGIGLAANQMDIALRIVTIHIPKTEETEEVRFAMVNPAITWHSDEKEVAEEGCLSVPGVRADVERAFAVDVTYIDYDGNKQTRRGEGLLARAIQHEVDHLDGILFINRIADHDKKVLRQKLKQIKRKNRSRLELANANA